MAREGGVVLFFYVIETTMNIQSLIQPLSFYPPFPLHVLHLDQQSHVLLTSNYSVWEIQPYISTLCLSHESQTPN